MFMESAYELLGILLLPTFRVHTNVGWFDSFLSLEQGQLLLLGGSRALFMQKQR